MGERLAALAVGDRVLRLGFSGIGDYGRERLGMSGRTAQELARLARELRDRPVLAGAVRQGEVSARKAEVVLAVARGEAEAAWVERARVETVRALKAAVAAAAGASPEEDERWEDVCVPLTPAQRETFDQAMALAGRVLGATAPVWQRLEALCTEFLGSHAAEVGEEEGGLLRLRVEASWLEAAKQALEEETRRWAFLDELTPLEPVAAPECATRQDPVRLDAELQELVALRDRWDEVMGHLAMLLQMLGLWRDMKFATFDQYCAERLGMATRTVQQRAWLARRFYFLPGLREALREGASRTRRRASSPAARTTAPWRGGSNARKGRPDRPALHRHLAGGRLTAADPSREGDRARPGPVPDPRLQSSRPPRTPRAVPVGGWGERPDQSHRPLCGSPSRRRTPWVRTCPRSGAGRTAVGGRGARSAEHQVTSLSRRRGTKPSPDALVPMFAYSDVHRVEVGLIPTNP